MKILGIVIAALAVAGCNMSEDEVRERAGEAAVQTKRAADRAAEATREAYDSAAEEGRKLSAKAGEIYSDTVLKGKVEAGFRLVKGLNHRDVKVEARDGVVHLSGTVPTQMDKVKAEGVAFGVTGDVSKVQSTVTVRD